MRNLYVKEYVNILCAADNPSIAGRAGAFMSLTMNGGSSSKRVVVEYELTARRLRAQVLDNFVRDKWGTAGLRIVSILRDCGKLDGEQVLSTCSSWSASWLTIVLSSDREESYAQEGRRAEISEGYGHGGTCLVFRVVPDGRQNAKSLNIPMVSLDSLIWISISFYSTIRDHIRFIDTPRTYASLLHSLYRTLGNILVRQHTERERVQRLLDKHERTDVQANIDQYMTRDERAVLEGYFTKRERLNVLASRIDESVFVFRDLAKNGFSEDDPYVPIDPLMK